MSTILEALRHPKKKPDLLGAIASALSAILVGIRILGTSPTPKAPTWFELFVLLVAALAAANAVAQYVVAKRAKDPLNQLAQKHACDLIEIERSHNEKIARD